MSARPQMSRYEEEVTRALASDDRVALMDAFADGAESPVQASKKLGIPLANAAYHCRSLEAAGLVRRRGYRQARGAVENLLEVTELGRAARDAAGVVAAAVAGDRPAKSGRRKVGGA